MECLTIKRYTNASITIDFFLKTDVFQQFFIEKTLYVSTFDASFEEAKEICEYLTLALPRVNTEEITDEIEHMMYVY